MVIIKPLTYAKFNASSQRAVFKQRTYAEMLEDEFAFTFKLGRIKKAILKPQFLFRSDDLRPLCVKKCNSNSVVGKMDIGAVYANAAYKVFSGTPNTPSYRQHYEGELMGIVMFPFTDDGELGRNMSSHISLEIEDGCDVELHMAITLTSIYTVSGTEIVLEDSSPIRLDIPIYMEPCEDEDECQDDDDNGDGEVVTQQDGVVVRYMTDGDFVVNKSGAPTVTNRIYETEEDLSFAFRLVNVDKTMLKGQVGIGLPPLEPTYVTPCGSQLDKHLGQSDIGMLKFRFQVEVLHENSEGELVPIFRHEELSGDLYASGSAEVPNRGFSFTLGLDIEGGCDEEVIIVVTPLEVISASGEPIEIPKGTNLFFTCIDYSHQCEDDVDCDVCE